MYATLVGFRYVDFEDTQTGRRIMGVSLYIVYDDVAEGLVGQVAGKVFYNGTVDASWVGQAIKLDYSVNPLSKSIKLNGVTLAK